MEGTKGYSVKVKIGQHELAIEAEDAGFVQAMLQELKERFFEEIRRPWSLGTGEVKPVEPTKAEKRAAPAAEGELAKLLKRAKRYAHAILITLYYYRNRKTGLKPKEIKEALLENGVEAPKSVSNTLRYLKEKGFVELYGRLWRVTDKGAEEAQRLLG